MLLRICLILTIIAGLAIIGICQFTVRPHIQEIIDVRNRNKEGWDRELARANRLDRELAKTVKELADTKTQLTQAKSERDAAKAQFAAEQKRANGLSQKLDKTTQDLKLTRQNLESYELLGLTPPQITAMKADNENLRKAQEALTAENKVLLTDRNRLQDLVYELTNPTPEGPPLPKGSKGKVLVVDPKWDFVVVSLGEKDRMVPKGILMVERDGRLVAKVRITEVRMDRSIANVLPGWKLGEPMEGDVVFY